MSQDQERRQDPVRRERLTIGEQAVEIVGGRYNWQRPSEAEFADAVFTGGEPVKRAVARLFDRLEGNLDPEKVARLKEAFDRGVAIWQEAGLFTPEREKAGYVKPDFERDYQPLVTQETLSMAEPGEGLDKGYKTPVFTPMDVPLHAESPDTLSYFKLLEDALVRAFQGTAGGKQPNTLLVGPEKRVLKADQVNVDNILYTWERYLNPGVMHEVQKLDPVAHSGLSEEAALAQLQGTEKRTGGTLRFERDRLVMPSDVGESAMSALDWQTRFPNALPAMTSAQDLKQAVAHVIYCLETAGWIPDYYDYKSPKTSRVNLPLGTFVPDEGSKGAVPALRWDMGGRRFYVRGYDAVTRYSRYGVRPGVRMQGD